MLIPGQRERLADQLYGQIFNHILSGRLREGDRLPSENEIRAMFGASRPVVREALMRLRADGLVQARQGAGTFLVHLPAKRVTEFTRSGAISNYMRCIEVRLPLEAAAARFAAMRRTPRQLDEITAVHEEFIRKIKLGAATAESDMAFHEAILKAAGNEFFVAALRSISAAVHGFMSTTLGLTRTGSKGRTREVIEEHTRIIEAIGAQDADGASLAMQFHIVQARQRLVDRNRDQQENGGA